MSQSLYDQLEQQAQEHGPEAAAELLIDQLRQQKRFHELFDALLIRSRMRFGLPVILTRSLDDLEEPLRTQVEEAYLEACREVGLGLLEQGRVREAWTYLRPPGEVEPVAQALRSIQVTEDNLDELIEVAVHEGVCPERGFELVLEHYGICNAITLYDAQMHFRPREQQQAVAALLLRYLHPELVENVRADIARREPEPPQTSTLEELVADRSWLFENDAYHIDTSHLHSVVRFARVLQQPEELKLAADLCAYGKHLGPQFQFQNEEPFAGGYADYERFFRAQLGQGAEEALEFFAGKARSLSQEEHGMAPAEVYVELLCRLGRWEQALEAAAELIPPGAHTTGFAPSLLELAARSGRYDRLKEISRRREDLLGFVAGLLEDRLQQAARS